MTLGKSGVPDDRKRTTSRISCWCREAWNELPGARREMASSSRGGPVRSPVYGWPERRELDLERLGGSVRTLVLMDDRSLHAPDAAREACFGCLGVDR